MNLNNYIRDIPDFPKKGIVYKDITTLLKDATAYTFVINKLFDRYKDQRIDKVIGIEARGFIIAASLATKLNCGMIPIRKVNKLPYKTYKYEYQLEYGKDCMEMHIDAIAPNDNILLVDDVLATGGTIEAAIKILKNFNYNLVECAFLIELLFLNGKNRISEKNINHYSLIKVK